LNRLSQILSHFDHKQKALIATIVVEIILLILLFQIRFPQPPVEEELSINFMPEEDFDFEQLKQEEKIEIPDITEYLNNTHLSSLASNEWQEEASETEENDSEEGGDESESEEDAEPVFEKLSREKPDYKMEEEKNKPKQKKDALGKSFHGNSNIKYFVPGRYKTRLVNPVYTCPSYMHGKIRIRIGVDRSGKVVKAEYDAANSTSRYDCLVRTALKYSWKARFNKSNTAPELQTGYIDYFF